MLAHAPKHFGSSYPRTNKISILEVEAIQLVAGLLGVHDVFKDDVGGALGVVCNALTYLADGPKATEKLEEILRRDVVAIVACQSSCL